MTTSQQLSVIFGSKAVTHPSGAPSKLTPLDRVLAFVTNIKRLYRLAGCEHSSLFSRVVSNKEKGLTLTPEACTIKIFTPVMYGFP
jgi:hypothetical protein